MYVGEPLPKPDPLRATIDALTRADEANAVRACLLDLDLEAATDVCYLVCTRRLLARAEHLYPQFATHNAHTIAAVLEMLGSTRDFEFQRLHGIGEALYRAVVEDDDRGVGCRIYAPVGHHKDLLPYLVRRLLENGANSLLVRRLHDARLPIAAIVQDPIAPMRIHAGQPNPRIPFASVRPVQAHGSPGAHDP